MTHKQKSMNVFFQKHYLLLHKNLIIVNITSSRLTCLLCADGMVCFREDYHTMMDRLHESNQLISWLAPIHLLFDIIAVHKLLSLFRNVSFRPGYY